MAKGCEKTRKRLQVYFIAACLAFAFNSVNPLMAQSPLTSYDPKLTIMLNAPKPQYLSPEQIKEFIGGGKISPAPMQPKYIFPPKTPSEAEVSIPSQPMGMLTGGPKAGKTIFVYDNMNRLIRAIYDQTTVTYSYDQVGNRLTQRVILSKPMGTIDFDADAKNDIAVYRRATGYWYVYPSGGGQAYGFGWGGDATDKPVPGDYDGDGKTDFAIYRSSTGVWYIKPSGGVPEWYGVYFGGGASDVPVFGDFDGDGKTDHAFYRPEVGVWFVLLSGSGSYYGEYFGAAASDLLVPGDYDGDGKTDYGFYRPSTGVWYIKPSGGVPSWYGVYFGGDPSDIPLTTNLYSIY